MIFRYRVVKEGQHEGPEFDDCGEAQEHADYMAATYGEVHQVIEERYTFDDSELVYTAEPDEDDEGCDGK